MRYKKIIQLCAWKMIADPEKWEIGEDYACPLDEDLIEGPEDYLYFKNEKAARKYAEENYYYDFEISSFASSRGLRFWKKMEIKNY